MLVKKWKDVIETAVCGVKKKPDQTELKCIADK